MRKLMMVCCAVAGLALAVDAAAENRGGDRRHRAPEPVTLLGLGIGAAAIGGAAWRARRKR